jgi:hypothetical protein
MDGFLPCPGRKPLASDGLPSTDVSEVTGIHSQLNAVVDPSQKRFLLKGLPK